MPTKIEWAEETWNPITGCSPISEACDHCWAERMANRLRGRYGYPLLTPFQPVFHEDRIKQPFQWRKPKMIFVCSMGDLFHGDIIDREINSVFLTMVNADWHTYLILTKRPERMLDFVKIGTGWRQNMSHVWLGVTAENQRRADERIPILLQIPAAVRFVSVEPMLQHVNLDNFVWKTPHIDKYRVDWVICGAETGPGARYMKPEWANILSYQCAQARVPFFFKKASKGTELDLPREYPEI